MPTLIEYFNNDFEGLKIESKDVVKCFKREDDSVLWEEPLVKNCWCDMRTGTRQLTYYVEESPHYNMVIQCITNNYKKDIAFFAGTGIQSMFKSDTIFGPMEEVLTKRIYIYCNNRLTPSEISSLKEIINDDFSVIIRDLNYLEEKMVNNIPMAFISHDSRDKELIARPIANMLQSRLCTVWYDEFSLKVGQSLRESIERGIKEAKKCIIILTPNFIKNTGWSKKEFNSIFTRELIFDEKIILPIWYHVTKEDIYDYSPALADTFALTWPDKEENGDELKYKQEIELLVSKLHTEIRT